MSLDDLPKKGHSNWLLDEVPPDHPVAGLIHELLGCQWGRGVSTVDDKLPCDEQAVQIVVVHDGPQEMALKLCPKHRDRILEETDARPDG